MRTPSRRLAVALAALLAGLACGYRVLDPARSPGPSGGAIEIRLFENQSAESGLEVMLADAMVEEFARRGQLEPKYVGGAAFAEWALYGVIREVRVAPSSLSSVSLELEDRVEVVLDVSLLRGPERALVWRHNPLVMRELFLASSDAQVRESNKEQALRSLAAQLAARIHDELTQTQ